MRQTLPGTPFPVTEETALRSSPIAQVNMRLFPIYYLMFTDQIYWSISNLQILEVNLPILFGKKSPIPSMRYIYEHSSNQAMWKCPTVK